jgi:hypothetical protein
MNLLLSAVQFRAKPEGKVMDALEESTRNKILQEEKYRSEVRAQLQQTETKDKKKPIMAFLNSSFGLWALSALFITGWGAFIHNGTPVNRSHRRSKSKNGRSRRRWPLFITGWRWKYPTA